MTPTTQTPVGYHGGQQDHNPNKWQWAAALDHLGITYPASTRPRALALVEHLQGGHGKPCGGRHGYSEGISWGEGTFLWWGGQNQQDTCHLSIAGELVEHRPWAEQTGLLRELAIGARFTSGHLAFDIISDEPTGIIDEIRTWFECGYVRNYRTSAEYINRGTIDGETMIVGGGIYLGSERSTRRLLAYDKGAKLGNAAGQRHVRLELRTRDDHAHQMAMSILSDPSPQRAGGLVLGAIDVVDEIGYPPAAFLELVELVGTVEPIQVKREATSFEAFVGWARRALGRRLSEMAWLSGVPVEDLAAQLFAGMQPKKPLRMDRCLQGFQSGQWFSIGDTIE